MANDTFNTTFLLSQVKQGNEAAFAKIYDHFSKQIYRSILFLVKDDDTAQELLQELFLHVWKQRELIIPEISFWPYLYKVSKWLVHNHFRKIAQDKRLIDQLIITTVDYVLDAEHSMIDQETHALLAKAIENLPPQRRQVFKLCKFEGKSYQEVSEIMGISPATINNQIVEANKSVKQFFRLNHDLAVILFMCLGSTIIAHALNTVI